MLFGLLINPTNLGYETVPFETKYYSFINNSLGSGTVVQHLGLSVTNSYHQNHTKVSVALCSYTQVAFPNGPQSGPTGAQLGPKGAYMECCLGTTPQASARERITPTLKHFWFLGVRDLNFWDSYIKNPLWVWNFRTQSTSLSQGPELMVAGEEGRRSGVRGGRWAETRAGCCSKHPLTPHKLKSFHNNATYYDCILHVHVFSSFVPNTFQCEHNALNKHTLTSVADPGLQKGGRGGGLHKSKVLKRICIRMHTCCALLQPPICLQSMGIPKVY